MPFSWGAAARGGSDALEQLLAERYAKTQEAENVAREIAREQRAAQQWQQTMAFNQAEATRAGERFKAQQTQQELENQRIGRKEALDLSERKNKMGLGQMVGEMVTTLPEGPITPQQRRTMQAMKATDPDIPIPKEFTDEEEMVSVTVPGPGGVPVLKRVPASQLEGEGMNVYRAPVTGPQPDYEWVRRPTPDGKGQAVQIRKGTAQPGDVPLSSANTRDAATERSVLAKAKGFEAQPVVKRAGLLAETAAFAQSLDPNTKNPADDQALIYNFAKSMDPDSAVREGEYNTIQRYGQSLAERYGFNAARVFSNTAFLTPEARANMKATILSRYKAARNQYDALRKTYSDQIAGMGGDEADLVDYGAGWPSGDAGGNGGGDVVKWGKDAQGRPVRVK